jgi:divalent metal cation (Fe/Co/Zn/Cd) transporter
MDAAAKQARAAGRRLEYFTLAWNALEAVIAIGCGYYAASTALIGFGLDSVIESLSGTVLLWRLWEGPHAEQREARALKLVGVSFLVLAAYVAYESAKTLWHREPPDASYVGIGLAVASVIVMPLLARAKRKVARRLESKALHADSRQTDLCSYLSAILLVGLGANAVCGWWWADPIAGLLMVPIIGREGVLALRGTACGCHDKCSSGDDFH